MVSGFTHEIGHACLVVVSPAKLELPTSDLAMFLKWGQLGYNVNKILHPDVEVLS